MNVVRLHGKSVDLCILRDDGYALDKYVSWMNNEDILMNIGRNTKISTCEDSLAWCRENRHNAFNIIEPNMETNSHGLIGNCHYEQIGNTRNYSLGIYIGEKEARNKGYGTEVVKMLIKFCFEELNAHRVCLTLNSENTIARKCYENAGMKECGVEHETTWCNGHWTDTVHMEILEQDYFK